MNTLKDKGIQECSICNQPFNFYEKFGNNAQPINNGRCCNNCNNHTVIPARLELFANRIDEQEFCKNYSSFYGEEITSLKQIEKTCFTGVELKEFVEHCITQKKNK